MTRYTLSNGLRVITERMPQLRSVSMGVWVRAGSALETDRDNGLSHFMEHMAFKGTQKRTALAIAEEMDAVGGQLNAATSKLSTCYYARVIDQDAALAADILSDIVINPALDEKELDKERSVVLEEIGMAEDSPEDVVYDVIAEAMFASQPLGQTILGPKERIEGYTRGDFIDFRAKFYGPRNAAVAVTGNFDEDAMRDLLEASFGSWSGAESAVYGEETLNAPPRALARVKDIEQVHLCAGYRGKRLGDPDIYAQAVMSGILGGGMSSRLFQHIREELGLVYTVYAAPAAYPTCGDLTVYAAATPKNARRVLDKIDEEIALFLRDGVTEKEFVQGKAQLKGGFILGQESAYNRMNSAGSSLILLDRVRTDDEVISLIDQVTIDDVMRVAREALTGEKSLAVVGRKAEQYLPR